MFKRVLWAFSGIISAVLLAFCSSVNTYAINLNTRYMGSYQLTTASRAYTFSGTAFSPSYQFFGGQQGITFSLGSTLSHVDLFQNNANVVSGSILSLYVTTAGMAPLGVSCQALESRMTVQPLDDSIAIIDQQALTSCTHRVDILLRHSTYHIKLVFGGTSGSETANIAFIPGGWYTLENINLDTLENNTQEIIDELKKLNLTFNSDTIVDSIEKSSNQAHKDSQEQLNWQKEQAEKEEQQRLEDEKKAQDSANSSQSDADSSQSDVDSASASLFEIVNSVKDTILQGSNTGNCSISGDFGFFSVGSINLCTGGSKIQPITAVAGAVMLLFFTFTSALTLLHMFLDLYNDSFR